MWLSVELSFLCGDLASYSIYNFYLLYYIYTTYSNTRPGIRVISLGLASRLLAILSSIQYCRFIHLHLSHIQARTRVFYWRFRSVPGSGRYIQLGIFLDFLLGDVAERSERRMGLAKRVDAKFDYQKKQGVFPISVTST